MFSYRHAFHAGNHADVFKHIVLQQVLLYMEQKATPFYYIDTHAGAGAYPLTGTMSEKSGEAKLGVLRLSSAQHPPMAVAQYLELLRAVNPGSRFTVYPGSPYIAQLLLRPQDRIRLFEMHPSDYQTLQGNVQQWSKFKGAPRPERGKRIMVVRSDGFASLKSLLPPPSRRALVLIDPPYEVKRDYRMAVDALSDALRRFPTGVYAIWYPVLQRLESRRFAGWLKEAADKEWLHLTFRVASPVPDGTGFTASGMFIVNPPWRLADTLRDTLPYLVKVLGRDEGADFTVESGVG